MMGRFVALLRGINVGRAKRVPMAELRELMLALGYCDVRTLLNSGNVVFSAQHGSAATHAPRISAAVAKRLGVTTQVVTVSASDFAAVLAENPLRAVATDSPRLLVAFTQAPAAFAALAERITTRNWATVEKISALLNPAAA